MSPQPPKRWPSIEPIRAPGHRRPGGRFNPHASSKIPPAEAQMFNRALNHFQWKRKKLGRPITYLSATEAEWIEFVGHVNRVSRRYLRMKKAAEHPEKGG